MTLDLRNVIYSSTANAFKNTGVFPTSVTLSGVVGAGVEVTNTSVVTLTEIPQYVFARANYTEYLKGGAASWQPFPTFDANIASTGGNFTAYLIARVAGTVVTFTAGMKNGSGTPITLTPTTYNIVYVTYTVTS